MDLPQGPLRSPRASSTGNFSSGTGLCSPQAGGVGDDGGRSRSSAPDYRRYERQAEEMIAKSPRYATPPRGRFGDQSPPSSGLSLPGQGTYDCMLQHLAFYAILVVLMSDYGS